MSSTKTVVVMGPAGSGKSEFIELIAGPLKLQPDGSSIKKLRAISISPYFGNDGNLVQLVKFPGFSENGMDPTDVDLFNDFAMFLKTQKNHQQTISGIIYMHRITDDGLKGPDVERNFKMLGKIAGEALKNVIVATSGWGRENDGDAKEKKLQELLPQFHQFTRFKSTKLSAISILNRTLLQNPEPLLIQLELDNEDLMDTSAGLELYGDIKRLIHTTRDEVDRISDDIRVTRGTSRQHLVDQRTQLKTILASLDTEQLRLEAPENWERAEINHTALDDKIDEQRIIATTDWKDEYDKLLLACDKVKNELREIRNWGKFCGVRFFIKNVVTNRFWMAIKPDPHRASVIAISSGDPRPIPFFVSATMDQYLFSFELSNSVDDREPCILSFGYIVAYWSPLIYEQSGLGTGSKEKFNFTFVPTIQDNVYSIHFTLNPPYIPVSDISIDQCIGSSLGMEAFKEGNRSQMWEIIVI